MSARGLTIGQLAESAGVNLETVRYYERIGLMPEPDRTPGGHRSYAPDHRRQLRFIRRARELGFGIDAIRKLISLSEPAPCSCAQVKDMAAEHLDAIEAKIIDLQRLKDVLQQAVTACENGRQACCPVIAELGSEFPSASPLRPQAHGRNR